jgi:hypothetical protein
MANILQTARLLNNIMVVNLYEYYINKRMVAYLSSALLNDPLHLFMHEFYAPQRRLFQAADLPLDQQLK